MFWFDHRRQLAVLVPQGLCDEAFVFLGKRFKFDVSTAATSIVDNLESMKEKKKKKDLISSSFLSPKLLLIVAETLLIVACRCKYKLLIQIAYELVFGCFQIFATGWQRS